MFRHGIYTSTLRAAVAELEGNVHMLVIRPSSVVQRVVVVLVVLVQTSVKHLAGVTCSATYQHVSVSMSL